MKTLQNNFTTPEQSKRLLELGVPVDSADLIQVQDAITTDEYIMVRNEDEPIGEFIENNQDIIPCWSVGRLIEIYEIVGENAGQCVSTTKSTSRIESLVQLYEENATLLDFSKLEEV